MKIGVCLPSLGLPFRQGLPKISRLGVAGLEVDAAGELAPDQLTDTGRREVRNLLKTYDLALSALNCPLRRGIDVLEDQQPRLEVVRKAMALAFELGPRMVVVQCPRIPAELETPEALRFAEALHDLGRYGDKIGVRVALEIGFDSAETVVGYLNRFDYGSLGVCYDPANLLLHGHPPAKNVLPLQHRLLNIHARDARSATVGGGAAEVQLGAGDVEWLSLVGALTAIEYRGFLSIERERGRATVEEVAAAVAFLRKFVI